MNASSAFFDTNILLYLLSADVRKADIAEELLTRGGHVNIQVLNEFASVATRKLKLAWPEVEEILTQVRAVCTVSAVTLEGHLRGLRLAARYRLSLYDAMIVAAALELECSVLYSEDMQHAQVFDAALRVHNPFRQ
jgi:predicted nucleic acid-binding protein